ncbi:MAG: ImmA/IrrE family metallo-endopeptidase [Cytophagales bacterium]|nr:MAG: ImmA/IrrE family metallo-endopeptidase [Cytophagales bacterium]
MKLSLEKLASEFRQAHGLNDRQPIRLRSLLQDLNVKTVFKPLSDGFAGMAVKAHSERFMLVNSDQILARQHFTICHELYHLFIQKVFTSQMCNPGQFNYKDSEELNADWFAAYLLIPRDGVLMQIVDWDELEKNQISLATILHLEQFFSCSRQALLIRLEEIGLIDRAYGEQFKSNIKRSAIEHGYSTDLYEAGNHNLTLGDYGAIARQLYDTEQISESHYAGLLLDLGVDLNELTTDYV